MSLLTIESSAPHIAPELSPRGILRGERIKLTSLRSVRITLGVTVGVGVLLSALIALLWRSEVGPGGMLPAAGEGYQTYLLMVSTFTAPFLALVFGVLGVFAVTSEFASGMIRSTLTAVPRRGALLRAKAWVTMMIAVLTAVTLVGVSLMLGAALLPAAVPELISLQVITGAVGTVIYLVAITFFAFGVATLLRSTAGGIAVVTGLTFVLPVALQILTLTGWGWVVTVLDWLPASLGTVLSQGFSDVSAGSLAYGAALAGLLIWVAAALIPADVSFRIRDIG